MALTFRRDALGELLKEAWPVWALLLGVGASAVVAVIVSDGRPDQVRYAGTLLQILGLGTVAVGLGQVRELFGRPSLVHRVSSWMTRLVAVFRTPEPISVHADAAGVGMATGRLRLVVRARPDASIDERVSVLETNLVRLREEVSETEATLTKEIGRVRKAARQEQQARERESHRINRQIEEMAVGGLHLETVGLIWLALGVAGTSIPDEIARWVERVCAVV